MDDQIVEMFYDDGVKPQKLLKLKHRQPFEVKKDTPTAQLETMTGWNEMRQCLIDNNLMESK